MTKIRWDIPDKWKWVTLGEIADIVSGGTPTAADDSNFDSNGIPWITPSDLTGYENSHIWRGRRSLSQKGFSNSSARLVPADSVLFSSRAPIGYCVIAANELCTNQGFKSFVLFAGIRPEYTRYYLLSSVEYIEGMSSGTTFKELSGSKASEIAYPLAPLPEQLRIESKIDSLTTKSKSAFDHLDCIPRLVEKYKQGILEAAFSGQLTTSWRNIHNETAAPLMNLSDVAIDFSYGTSAKSSSSGEIPVLRMGNIQDGKLNWGNLVFTSDIKEIEKYSLSSGDVLFNRTNSPELVGKTALYSGERPAIYAGYLIRIRCSERIMPAFLTYCLNSPAGRDYCQKVKSDGINQSNINAKKLAAFKLPVPSIDEQIEIIHQIDESFNWIEELSREANNARRLIKKLNQSIFSKAFSGNLVPQNNDDESIDILFNRILAEKENKKLPVKKTIRRIKISETNMNKKLIDVLSEAKDWLSAHEIFRQCGVIQSATTEEIEPIYAELRILDQAGLIVVESIRDDEGRKLYDRIKLNERVDHAS